MVYDDGIVYSFLFTAFGGTFDGIQRHIWVGIAYFHFDTVVIQTLLHIGYGCMGLWRYIWVWGLEFVRKVAVVVEPL